MGLYDLVSLKKSLKDNLTVESTINELLKLQERLTNIKIQVPVLLPEQIMYIDYLILHYDKVIELANKPVIEFDIQLQSIEDQIYKITQQLFAGNYNLETQYGSVEFVRNNRRIYINEDVENLIKQRILLYTNWRYPALEIGCRDGEWTQYLVAADPLYIMDRQSEFLESTAKRFTPEYQRRLQQYPLINHNLSSLPQNQFAFVFSWGYFNYVSLDTIKQYLKQFMSILRPGGVVMFSFNDGDTPAGAGMAENFAQTYMPKSLLKPLSESLGFEIVKEFHNGTNISWIELKKPGELETTKAHQVMGEIKKI
jgi:SAM-dependent methyltransferase